VARAASTRPNRPAPNTAPGRRRDDPDRRRADASDAGDPRQQRDERRLVHVAEREMVPRHQEVQLVLLEALPGAERELDRHEHHRDHPGERRDAI
jgi:hypothetical protein